jgi:hypothetical protein
MEACRYIITTVTTVGGIQSTTDHQVPDHGMIREIADLADLITTGIIGTHMAAPLLTGNLHLRDFRDSVSVYLLLLLQLICMVVIDKVVAMVKDMDNVTEEDRLGAGIIMAILGSSNTDRHQVKTDEITGHMEEVIATEGIAAVGDIDSTLVS